MQLSRQVDRELLEALRLGDRAVLVEDERLEGGQLGVGLGVHAVGPVVPRERPTSAAAEGRAGDEQDEAVASLGPRAGSVLVQCHAAKGVALANDEGALTHNISVRTSRAARFISRRRGDRVPRA